MLLRKMSLMMDEVDGYDSIDWCNCCTFLCLSQTGLVFQQTFVIILFIL